MSSRHRGKAPPWPHVSLVRMSSLVGYEPWFPSQLPLPVQQAEPRAGFDLEKTVETPEEGG